MTEFVVRMENRPGRLATLTEALATFGVNIEALAAYGHDGDGTVRLIVDDAVTARRVLTEADLHHEENAVLTAELPHRPGELARLTRSIADAGINIDAIYVLKASPDGIELAIALDQPASAMPDLGVTGGVLADRR
ncbi:MAG: ACT domain-containing protein [Acidimicrobiia bacterium]|nr:ACT domain-containing protein [Acidimicrobiia bacterium]